MWVHLMRSHGFAVTFDELERYSEIDGGTVQGVSIAITAPPAVKISGNNEGADVTRVVKNTGAQTVYLSRDPAVTSVATSEFSVPTATTSPPISLAPGEELYAVCAAGQASTVEVI